MTSPLHLLRKEQIHAEKSLGQNFMSQPASARMIVDRCLISPRDRVLEIGPGLGALTIAIAEKTRHVIAVEKDPRLVPLLTRELEAHGIDWVDIRTRDILKTDIAGLAGDSKLLVIGNLPYNISSQILFKLIQERKHIDRAVLMFQKELADRIAAPPGSRDFSRLSAVVRYASGVTPLADVTAPVFFPAPKVNSRVLAFDFCPSAEVPFDVEAALFRVIKAAFSQRRKSVKNALAGPELGIDKSRMPAVLSRAAIDGARRAETLSIPEFLSLTRAVMQEETFRP